MAGRPARENRADRRGRPLAHGGIIGVMSATLALAASLYAWPEWCLRSLCRSRREARAVQAGNTERGESDAFAFTRSKPQAAYRRTHSTPIFDLNSLTSAARR
jgi:hypothetical protein